jgi:hypothetical protein
MGHVPAGLADKWPMNRWTGRYRADNLGALLSVAE